MPKNDSKSLVVANTADLLMSTVRTHGSSTHADLKAALTALAEWAETCPARPLYADADAIRAFVATLP